MVDQKTIAGYPLPDYGTIKMKLNDKAKIDRFNGFNKTLNTKIIELENNIIKRGFNYLTIIKLIENAVKQLISFGWAYLKLVGEEKKMGSRS